jgi:hypothetical protein
MGIVKWVVKQLHFPSFLFAPFLLLNEMDVLPSLQTQGAAFGLASCYPHVSVIR